MSATKFWCPGCEDTHIVSDAWQVSGEGTTLTISPSVLVLYGNRPGDKRCHSFVKNGQIEFLNDCTHQLAGQTVPLPITAVEHKPEELQQILDQTVEIHLQKLFDDLHTCCEENNIPVASMSATLAHIDDLSNEFDAYIEGNGL